MNKQMAILSMREDDEEDVFGFLNPEFEIATDDTQLAAAINGQNDEDQQGPPAWVTAALQAKTQKRERSRTASPTELNLLSNTKAPPRQPRKPLKFQRHSLSTESPLSKTIEITGSVVSRPRPQLDAGLQQQDSNLTTRQSQQWRQEEQKQMHKHPLSVLHAPALLMQNASQKTEEQPLSSEASTFAASITPTPTPSISSTTTADQQHLAFDKSPVEPPPTHVSLMSSLIKSSPTKSSSAGTIPHVLFPPRKNSKYEITNASEVDLPYLRQLTSPSPPTPPRPSTTTTDVVAVSPNIAVSNNILHRLLSPSSTSASNVSASVPVKPPAILAGIYEGFFRKGIVW